MFTVTLKLIKSCSTKEIIMTSYFHPCRPYIICFILSNLAPCSGPGFVSIKNLMIFPKTNNNVMLKPKCL